MGWKNKTDLVSYHGRRSARYAEQGLLLEDRVENLLKEMREAGLITEFKRHAHNSVADLTGQDFTVIRDGSEISFGVTISIRRWNKSRRLHDDPQLCFPLGTKPDTMVKRILELFPKE